MSKVRQDSHNKITQKLPHKPGQERSQRLVSGYHDWRHVTTMQKVRTYTYIGIGTYDFISWLWHLVG